MNTEIIYLDNYNLNPQNPIIYESSSILQNNNLLDEIFDNLLDEIFDNLFNDIYFIF